ncbi:MAG: HAMP domain-containing protein [Elusimicrobia bacterium]|nr:HAMP domain-containing protein [Elusimicrobiota bacterium]
MAAVTRRGKLAYKILFWFLLISLAPMGVVGYHLVNISQSSLRKETLAMQEALAVGFADTVYKYVMNFKNVLAETSGLEEFTGMNPVKQQQYLNRIIQVHLAILELSVVNADGTETLRTGRYLGPSPEMRQLSKDESFVTAMSRGQYIGKLERFQGLYPAMTLAVAILDPKAQPPKPMGVLSAKVSLNGLSALLSIEFPQTGKGSAAVVHPDGFLIAHSNYKEVYRPDAKLSDDILKVVTTQTSEKGGGEIELSGGERLLGAYSDVKDLGWVVYIQQPVETAYQTAAEMRRQIFRVFLWVVLFTVILSLAVANHITQPVRLLREAADRLGRGQFEDMPEMMLTNDEIGDLAQTFLAMSDSLKEKTGELIHAKQELEKFTKFLEKRVEARTRELKAAQDELIKKERLAAIGQMASVVGHEIRNPLAVINNSIYFIKTKLGAALDSDPKIAKHIKIIESEIQQANGIINEILTYSRQRELKPERVLLNSFLDELLSVYPFPAHIKVEKAFDAANPMVDIDPTEMQQALRNLIGNAIEVMPASGRVAVRTRLSEEGGAAAAVIEIADSGPGIPQDVLDKIFTPFFTTKARGTGLGLAVVRKVVDRHNGRVDVESVVGRGTVFRLFLPVAQKIVNTVKS